MSEINNTCWFRSTNSLGGLARIEVVRLVDKDKSILVRKKMLIYVKYLDEVKDRVKVLRHFKDKVYVQEDVLYKESTLRTISQILNKI